MRKTKKRFQYSIKRQLIISSFLIFCLFILFVTEGTTYVANLFRTQIYANIKDMHELYKTQMKNEFKTLDTYLYGTVNNSADITVLDDNQRDTNYYISMIKIQNTIQNILPCFSGIDGLFVYSVRSDSFIYCSSKYPSDKNCISYLQERLMTANKNNNLNSINLRNWFVVIVNGSNYFLRFIKVGNSYVGAWANTESFLSVFESMKNCGAQTMFLSLDGKTIGNEDFNNVVFNPAVAVNDYKMVKDPHGASYLMISDKLDYSDNYLMTLVPSEYIASKLSSLKITLVVTGIAVLILGIFLTFLQNRYLSKPLKSLLTAIGSLRAGNFSTKVDPGKAQCVEFIQVNNAFNDMVDNIQKLKIDIYEEQLDRKHLELKYLKSQIAPHFLINCLNSIYYLSSEPKNHDIIQKMTLTLSDHLRYTLENRSRVRLLDEIKYAANYLELAKLRFPNSMTFEFDIDPRTEDASIFPLLVLMFVENTVKHELVMGEQLHVWVKSKLNQSDNGARVHLTIIDSGDGFPDEFLDAVTQQDYISQDNTGNHIGITNIIRRLKMEYGDNASIAFSNEFQAGARIDIDISYQVYQSEG